MAVEYESEETYIHFTSFCSTHVFAKWYKFNSGKQNIMLLSVKYTNFNNNNLMFHNSGF